MNVLGLAWLGVRTDRYAEQVAFARDVLGLRFEAEIDGMSVFRMRDGSTLEVFGPESREHDHFTTGPVAGFLVADVVEARRELEAAGIEIAGAGESDGGAYAWVHFRAPDGYLYEVTHTPASRSAAAR